MESKSTAYDKLAEDLSTQHSKTVELRRQVSTLEQTIQTANSAAASTRFREQSLQQELELLKKNNEWFETELKTKSAEYLKYRKDKSARISELQRQNEQAISDIESLKRTEVSLRTRLNESIQQYEESLSTIQELKDEAVRNADSFRADLEAASRLAELQKQTADTAKQRVSELEEAVEQAKDDAAEEIGRVRAEAETESADKEAAENRVTELESAVEQLESQLEQLKSQEMTPLKGVNGNAPRTPSRAGTPTGVSTPASSRFKGGLTVTQMYSEYKSLEKRLATETRNNEQLTAALDEVVQDLESSKPEIEELRADHSRMETEMVDMSALMDKANQERDSAVRDARKTQGNVTALIRQGEILRQQVRDLSSQIKVLLMEQHLREAGGQELTTDQTSELERVAMGNVDEESLTSLNDTGRLISRDLTTFKSIPALVERNTQLLEMIRQLGDQLESNEAQEKERVRQVEHEELENLRVRVNKYKDELQSMVTQSKSYVKERDMFRNLLMRRGQQSQHGDSMFDQSITSAGSPPPGGVVDSVEMSPSRGDEHDYAKLLKELQRHFDSYRQESATDMTSLKQQVNELSQKNSHLQTEASRTTSQLGATNQRNEMLQSNFSMLKAEHSELQKRYYSAMENSTKQEVKTQQAAEELVEAKGVLESMRRETANLKAEKDLWKNVEKRLVEDNESLRNERARLDSLNSSLQNILNEREQSDSETRRRLQTNVETLQSDLQATKRKLDDEVEENKKATLRREYEHEQNQKRIDDLMTNLGSIREEMASTKTARDHLQARVDEMTIELRSAEERIEVLQSKPAPVQTTSANGAAQQSDEGSLSREQELAVEVSELKRDLELRAADIDRANEQVEDYKSISQQTEERLQEMTDSNDQYREETDRLIQEKDNKIRDLEQRCEDISSELSTTNTELSKLRDEQSESGRRLDEQKASFEVEIARLKDEDEKHTAAAQFYQQDLKAQAEIAQGAQQNYEDELRKHAQALTQLQTLREETNALKLEAVGLKTEAQSARTSLTQKEESWSELKDRYERELTDLRKRREEVMNQNTLLHQQLEGITKQVTSLQRDRENLADNDSAAAPSAPALENLQEVIKYLRREKEIVDVQYHLSTQESKRLRQQLDHTQSQLEETRLKLDQQRRAEADTERNAMNHNKLMETLTELNLFRESSVTLRNQARQAEASLADRTLQVEKLQEQIEPLQVRIGELENLLETKEGERKLLEEDRDRWQTRMQSVLSKYDRTDPAEIEAMKQKLASLEAERDEAVAARQSLQEQVDNFPKVIEEAKTELRTRLADQFKERSKTLSGRIRDKQAEVDAGVTERENLQAELQQSREELEALKSSSAAAAPEPVQNGITETSTQDQPNGTSSGPENTDQVKELEEKVRSLETSLAEKEQELVSLRQEQENTFKAREEELKEGLNKQLSEAQASAEAHKQDLEALRVAHQQLVEAQKTEGTTALVPQSDASAPQQTAPSTEGPPTITLEIARELVSKNEIIRNMVLKNIRTQVDKALARERESVKTHQATTGEANTSVQTATIAQLEEQLKKLEAEKAALTSQLDEEQKKFQAEKEAQSVELKKKIADAVMMAEKRLAVKQNVAERRAVGFLAKNEVVAKAAIETPERPVGEVWQVANAKPAPPAPAVATQRLGLVEGGQVPQTSAVAAAAKATPPSTVNVSQPTEGQSSSPAPTPTPTTSATQQQNQVSHAQQPQTAENAQTSNLPVKPATNQTNHPNPNAGPARLLSSALPTRGGGRGARGGQFNQHPNQSQGSQSSNEGPQNNPRGSGIPRGGRGRGGPGRGAANQNVQTSNLPQPSAQGQSPGGGRGNLNPGAKQFNPQGNKRARDDSTDDGASKRIRGGGASS